MKPQIMHFYDKRNSICGIQLSDGKTWHAGLTPAEARQTAKALIDAADDIDQRLKQDGITQAN